MNEEIGAALSQGVTKLKFSKDGIAELNIDLPGNGSLYLVAEHKSPEDSPKTDIQVSMSKDNLSYKFMIDRILKRRGLNQTELAKILGVTASTICRYLHLNYNEPVTPRKKFINGLMREYKKVCE